MKILIISGSAFSKTLNNGKTFEAMFSKFEVSELCQFYMRPQDDQYTDFDYADSYYAVSDADIISHLRNRKIPCGGVRNKNEVVSSIGMTTTSAVYNKFKNNPIRKNFIIRNLLWNLNTWKNDKLDLWLKDCKPDRIFVVPGGDEPMYDIALYIHKKLNVPIDIFYTDDYLIYPISESFLDCLKMKLVKKKALKLISTCSRHFCIGQQMAIEYSEAFGKPFLPIMNAIEMSNEVPSKVLSKPLIMSYFGSMHSNRWKMISRVADLFAGQAIINVYSKTELSEEMAESLNKENIKMCGFLQQSEMKTAMENSDLLLHIESDDPYFRSKTRLSVSTKIPEYLSMKRLVIAYGPKELASIKLIKDNSIGCVIDSEISLEDQKKVVSEIIANLGNFDQIVEKAYSFAKNHFEINIVANEFKNQLLSSR